MAESERFNVACAFILFFGMGGCAVMDFPKYQLSEGQYKSSAFKAQSRKVFIDNTDDTIFVYSVNKQSGLPDTVAGRHSFPQASSSASIKSAYCRWTDAPFGAIIYQSPTYTRTYTGEHLLPDQ